MLLLAWGQGNGGRPPGGHSGKSEMDAARLPYSKPALTMLPARALTLQ